MSLQTRNTQLELIRHQTPRPYTSACCSRVAAALSEALPKALHQRHSCLCHLLLPLQLVVDRGLKETRRLLKVLGRPLRAAALPSTASCTVASNDGTCLSSGTNPCRLCTCFVAPGTSRTPPWSLMRRCFFLSFFFFLCCFASLGRTHNAAPWIVRAFYLLVARLFMLAKVAIQTRTRMLPPEKKRKKQESRFNIEFFSSLLAFLLFSTCIIHHGGCSIIAPVTACTATHPREVGSNPSSETLTANIETCLWTMVALEDGLSLLARADLLSVLV